jgi:ABC-type Zn2+ transport system substrate-binding protein/surface adhesin
MSETAITRADLDNLAKLFLDNIRQSEERTDERIRQSEERTDERIRQSEERTREHIYDTQNVMLTEFHKWAAPMATRVTAHQTLISLAEERLEILERKVK